MRPHLMTSKNRPTPADRYDRALLAARGWGVRPSSSALYIQSEALQYSLWSSAVLRKSAMPPTRSASGRWLTSSRTSAASSHRHSRRGAGFGYGFWTR